MIFKKEKNITLLSRWLYLLFSPLLILHKNHFKRKAQGVNPFYTSLIVQWLEKFPLLYDLSAFIWNFPQWSGIYTVIPTLSGNVLQVGCGTGLFNLYCRKQKKKYCLYNMDINPGYLSWGKKLKRMTLCISGDVHHLPFGDQSFDTILFTRCFHHFRKPKKVFQHCLRILKPNGQIIITDPVALYLDQTPKSFMINSSIDGLIWRYTPKTFVSHIRSNLLDGLELVDVRYTRQKNLSNFNHYYPHMDSVVVLRNNPLGNGSA